MRTIPELIAAVRHEAERADFPVDRPVYERSGKAPADPVLFAGSLDARLCVFGRDLGKDEVAAGQPMVGAAGKLVRLGIAHAFGLELPPGDRRGDVALGHALLTNTVPYKPPGNKAYAESVKERFRPFLTELLIDHWRGDRVITLGTEAFRWFARLAPADSAEDFWRRDDRYEAELTCRLVAEGAEPTRPKTVVVAPLPHPSPLNQRYYKQFPAMLARRLEALAADGPIA